VSLEELTQRSRISTQRLQAVVERSACGILWRIRETALGKLQRRYLDPVSGQAGLFRTIEEGSTSVIVTVRVKVDNRKIAEAEWLVARKGDPGLNEPAQPGQSAGNFFEPENLTASPPPDNPIAKEARASREALMAITNGYFDGITTHDGSIIIAHPGCTRVENGTTVTGRAAGPGAQGRAAPVAGVAPAGRGGPGALADCTSNLETITCAARGYPVVDEEARHRRVDERQTPAVVERSTQTRTGGPS
jgi:hypothetical protein